MLVVHKIEITADDLSVIGHLLGPGDRYIVINFDRPIVMMFCYHK